MKGETFKKRYVRNYKNKVSNAPFFPPSLLNNTLSPARSFSSAKSVIIRDDSSYRSTNPLIIRYKSRAAWPTDRYTPI